GTHAQSHARQTFSAGEAVLGFSFRLRPGKCDRTISLGSTIKSVSGSVVRGGRPRTLHSCFPQSAIRLHDISSVDDINELEESARFSGFAVERHWEGCAGLPFRANA